MTIREISEAAGCHIDTVRKVARPMYPSVKAPSKGYPIEYNKDESIAIMERLPKRNMVDTNPLENQVAPLDNSSTALFQMMQGLMKQQQIFMKEVLKEIRQPQINNNGTLQIEQVPEKSSRAIFKQEVDKLVALTKSDWSAVYAAIYAEMGYVYGVKVKARSMNRSKSTGKNIRPIDILESDGLMGKAIAITRQMIERFENGNN